MTTIKIHNATTGEVIEREMTEAELEQFEIDQEAIAAELNAKDEAAKSKVALLNRLGITEEEAKLLIS
jgi:hypothetical protein